MVECCFPYGDSTSKMFWRIATKDYRHKTEDRRLGSRISGTGNSKRGQGCGFEILGFWDLDMSAGKIFVGRKDELEQFKEVLKDPKGQAPLEYKAL